jgi:hypothetical protein
VGLTALLCGFFLWWWFRPTESDVAAARSPEKWATWAQKYHQKQQALQADVTLQREWLILAILAEATGHEAVAKIAQASLSEAERTVLKNPPLAEDLWLDPPWPDTLTEVEKAKLSRVRQLIDVVQIDAAQAELTTWQNTTPSLSDAARVLVGSLHLSLDDPAAAQQVWASVSDQWPMALSEKSAEQFLPHLAHLPHGTWFWSSGEKCPSARIAVLEVSLQNAVRTVTLNDWIRDGAAASVIAPRSELSELRDVWQAVATNRLDHASGSVEVEKRPDMKLRRTFTIIRALLWMNERTSRSEVAPSF